MTAGADLRLLRATVFTAACVTLSAAGHALGGDCGIRFWALGAGFALVFAVAVPLAGRERSLPGIAALLTVGQLGLHALFSAGQRQPAVPRSAHGGGHRSAVLELASRMLCSQHATGPLTEARAHRIVSDAGISPHQAAAMTGNGAAQSAGSAAHAGHGAAAGTPVEECLRQAARAALSLLDAPMLCGHLLAALVLGWLLRRGEAALWRLVRLSGFSEPAELSDLPGLPLLLRLLRPARALRAALAYERALRTGLLPGTPPQVSRAGAHEDSAHPPSVLLHHSLQRRGPPAAVHQLALAA